MPSHKYCEEDPFFGIRIALRVTANSRRRGIDGGEMSRTRRQDSSRPPRSGRPHGQLPGCREGGRTFSSDSSSGPSVRSPFTKRSPSLTLCDTPSRRAPRLASGQRLLTAMLAPCLAARSTFSSTDFSLASAPIDELELGEHWKLELARAAFLRTPAAHANMRRNQRSDARAMDGRAHACDVACVVWEERGFCPHT